MTIAEIKAALSSGQSVELFGGSYQVIKDNLGQYLIHCKQNDNYIGLHGQVGTKYADKLNYPASEFYVV